MKNLFIGIDVGGMSIKGGIVTRQGEILAKETVETSVYGKDKRMAQDVAYLIDKLIAKGYKTEDIAAAGIGTPGSVDSKTGYIRYSNNIRLENEPLLPLLEKQYPFPFFLNNDANCAIIGEQLFGAAKGKKDAVIVTLGTGVGTGILIDGKMFEGRGCAGAEAGHMVIKAGGNVCNCGRRGCFETYASASALIKMTKEKMLEDPKSLMHDESNKEGKVSGKTAFRAADRGDESAIQVVNEYIQNIGEGLLNLVNVFRPEVILIGGGISKEQEKLTRPLQEMMDRYSFGAAYNPPVEIKTALLENDAGILGAAGLAIASDGNLSI